MSDLSAASPASSNDGTDNVYRIALSMSGAISAGAYTAGVLDFLMLALAELEREKAARPARFVPPNHDVRIVAMAGASAGGICGPLSTLALGHGMVFPPVEMEVDGKKDTGEKQRIFCVLPSLYAAWVEKPRMVARNGVDPSLLTTEDLDNGKVVSALNAGVLNDIATAALRPPAHPATIQAPHEFLAKPLHLYLAISNLPGIQYEVHGSSDKDVYRMVNHADRVHICIRDIGSDRRVASKWAGTDNPSETLDLASLQQDPMKWKALAKASLATAAFPIGLSARALIAKQEIYAGRWFPAPRFGTAAIGPTWPQWEPPMPEPFPFVNVDGGMINNDPFEFARYSLIDDWETRGAANPSAAEDADRAVIMIAPFPEGAVVPTGGYNDDTGLLSVITRLLPTLTQQVRFKVSELAAAADPTYASRWLIAPRRRDSPDEVPSSDNIACGLLGGFGGFLDQRFREHDFLLGQRNCQNFLRNWTESKFNKTSPNDPWVVRLCGLALSKEIPAPDWPRMEIEALSEVSRRIKIRAKKLVPALVTQEVGSHFVRWLFRVVWWWVRDKVLNMINGMMLADLLRRDQIEDGMADGSRDRLRNFTPQERGVFAALALADYDARTVTGLATSLKLTESQIDGIIQRARALDPAAVHHVVQSRYNSKDGQPSYTLARRRLSAWKKFSAAMPWLNRVAGVKIG
ncbi:MAG TPA: hypothetical protein VKQ27_21590 [Acetobacteraceae bacterium]|nr:hypothetical protein [Acetobacteraceae bacterium]